jgi:thiol-disulfide isomerase/thioredoxin
MRIFIFVFLFGLGAYAYASSASAASFIENTHDAPAAFELQDVQGKLHRLSDYQGKWVIVNFWATWCSPCIKEIPELKRFHQQYRDQDIVVIGINFEELTVEQLQQAIDEFAIDYPVLRIGSVPLVPFEPLKGLPSTFAVSPEGRLVKSWMGPVDGEVLRSFIASQL